jgi:hypothetical protein
LSSAATESGSCCFWPFKYCCFPEGFSGDQGHVWSRKEVESYLLIPTALANISTRPLAEVQALISGNQGHPGKDRPERVLASLGMNGTPNNVIVQNALTACPGEIPAEL